MIQHAGDTLDDLSGGFLTDTHELASHIDGAVLLTANYTPDLFSDTLFDTLAVPCPANVATAAHKRKADYLAGRAIVQAAMSALGVPPSAVTSAPSRAPIWPEGLSGSISHARGRCACLVSEDGTHSFGIDTEAIAEGKSLTAILFETLTEQDQKLLHQSPFSEAITATLAFSAKEALFKALYPRVGRFFGFDAAELSAPPGQNVMSLTLTTDLTPVLTRGRQFTLHTALLDTHVLTWLAVPDT